MYFSLTLTLCLHFLLCQQVSASRYSFFTNQTPTVDKVDNVILGELFVEFNKVYLQKNEPRQIAIIGGSADELLQAQSLFESYPHVICRDPATCVYPEVLKSGSFFVIFLDDLGKNGIKINVKILSGCGNKCKFLFVFGGIINESSEILSFISRVIELSSTNSALAHVDKDGVTFHGPSIEKNCSLGVESMFVWKPGTDLSKINFWNFKMPDFKRCPIRVGSFRYMPQMAIDKKKNGSLTIAGGADGKLLLFIAEKLNFTIDLKHPSLSDRHIHSRKAALLKDVASGIIAFAVARFRPTNMSAFSMSYGGDCITWAVPRLMSSLENLLWTEFPWKVWALVGSVFTACCAIGYAHHIIGLSRNANRQDVGTIILDVVSITLENPAIRVPLSVGGKLMLITYLYYAMVITTAYKTSLASVLTTMKSSSSITDVPGLVEANLKVGGSHYHYGVLKDQVNASIHIPKLIQRYIVYSNDSEGLNRVKYSQDFACLARRSTLKYEKQMTVKAEKLINFNIFEDCVLSYPVVIAFPEGSPLLVAINKVIMHTRESGILQYWHRASNMNDKILEKKNADNFSTVSATIKFKKLFIFYIGCIVLCLLVFFVEILTAKFKLIKRRPVIHRPNQLYRYN